jgi:hypothetical protein
MDIEYNSAESVFIHPPRLGLSYAKLNVFIIHVKSFYSKTLSRPPSAGRRPGPPLRENCLWRSLCVLGASRILSLQKRHQLRSARVRRHTVFDSLASLAEHSADVLAPPCRQTPAQCGLFRSHLLVICAAKPRYTAAAAREHRRVLAPRLPTPGASVTSPLHAP